MDAPSTFDGGYLLTVLVVFIAIAACCFALVAVAGAVLHRRQMRQAGKQAQRRKNNAE